MKKKSILTVVTAFTVAAGAGSAYFLLGNETSGSPRSAENNPEHEVTLTEKSFASKAELTAAGDFLIHKPLYTDAFTGTSYDFNPMFEEVRTIFEESDAAYINQESILGGEALGLSSYPSFNSPHEAGDALLNAGMDVMNMANNHTLDKGSRGVLSAIRYYEDRNVLYTGAYKNERDQLTPRVLNRNGIRFGFLSYTYGTNGIPVPEGMPYLVNLIDAEKMKKDIREMRELADFVIVSAHWGLEYERFPNGEQKSLAAMLANEGANVIIGHHPHVLQPMEWITAKSGKKTLVIYSLGNFLSGQEGDYKDIGGIAKLTFYKKISGDKRDLQIGEPGFIPTIVTHSNKSNYKVRILKNVDPELDDSIKKHVLTTKK
ncbi:CapA family protein [Metabacillus mangrovi]|nr:CapA family protein [Metabacillus mangrovi]